MPRHPCTIGADPEFFIFDQKKDKIVSAVGLIPGTKEEPYPINSFTNIQRDNVLLEINIQPASSPSNFLRYMEGALSSANLFVKQINKDYRLLIKNVGYLDEEALADQEAFSFGCSRDYDIYGVDTIERIDPFSVGNVRTCGGHIHIGMNDPNPDKIERIVKLLDLYIGIPSVVYDNDKERKKLYGRAGRFRPTEYGLEYRTPSNYWCKTKYLINWIGNQVIYISNNFRDSYFARAIDKLEETYLDALLRTINTNDKEEAYNLARIFEIPINPELCNPEPPPPPPKETKSEKYLFGKRLYSKKYNIVQSTILDGQPVTFSQAEDDEEF